MQPALQIPQAPILITGTELVVDAILLAGSSRAYLLSSTIEARIVSQDGTRAVTEWIEQDKDNADAARGEVEIRIPAGATNKVTEGPVVLEIRETTGDTPARALLRVATLSVRRSPT